MKLAINLALAVATTLSLFGGGMLVAPQLFLVLVVVAALAGAAVLVVRRGHNAIPIASIFLVLMFGVLLWLGFLIVWHRGGVEL